jgi:hypothetical protein
VRAFAFSAAGSLFVELRSRKRSATPQIAL